MDAFKITPIEIQEMKNVNLLAVDKTQLVDINAIKINHDLLKEERILDFIRQIGNPYCFKIGDAVVKLKFSEDGITLEDRLKSYFISL